MPPTTNGDASVLSLKDLRATLTDDERRMVRDSMSHIERDLISAIPEMLAGLKATRKQSSMSPTIALIPVGKKGRNVKLKVSSRVRAEREGFEADYHIATTGQLTLGVEDLQDEDDDDPTSVPGFDPDAEPAHGEGAPATH